MKSQYSEETGQGDAGGAEGMCKKAHWRMRVTTSGGLHLMKLANMPSGITFLILKIILKPWI